MSDGHAVALLRPQPSGLPLRGRAAQSDGMISERLFAAQDTETGGCRFHLKFAAPWSKNRGKRICRERWQSYEPGSAANGLSGSYRLGP
jgi:hypothetical protein